MHADPTAPRIAPVAAAVLLALVVGPGCGGGGSLGSTVAFVPQLTASLGDGGRLRVRVLDADGTALGEGEVRAPATDEAPGTVLIGGLPEGEGLVLVLEAVRADGTVPLQHRRQGVELLGRTELGVIPFALGEMVYVPDGSFRMGDDAGLPDERPAHDVSSSAFFIDRFEVTNFVYEQYRQASGAEALPFSDLPGFGGDEQPALGASWDVAAAVCAFLGKRLPTEAEWEHAAQGPAGTRFPWGDAALDCDRAAHAGCGEEPGEVGSHPAGASPLGVQDLLGNASEWTADFYDPGFYALSPSRDPSGPGEGTRRVARGGSRLDPPARISITARTPLPPETATSDLGFRCAD